MQHIFIRQRQNKQAKVSRQKTGISEAGQRRKQFQAGVGVTSTGSEYQGSPGSNTEIRIRRMGKRSEMSTGARTRLRNVCECEGCLCRAVNEVQV